MQTFTLTNVNPMGDPHPQYGQTYWADAEGSDVNLMFSTNKPVGAGSVVSCEESVNKTSAKGKSYLLLKSVQVQDASGAQVKAPAPAKKTGYAKRDDSAIKAQWAIGQAVAMVGHGIIKPDEIEPQAMTFFAMVDSVKATPAGDVQTIFPGAEQIEIPGDN